ncbi:MAG: carboxypeptidase regulatory-like domain-containing protein [Pyrinomonadaceae bacterium]
MKFILSTISICLLLTSVALAQSATGRIVGTVQDPTGAIVPGATVKALNEETNVTYNTVSSDAGKYTFEALQPGPYTISVEQSGFKKYSTSKNVLTANDTATINIPLETGDVSETVQVEGTFEKVQTSQSGNTGAIFNQQSLKELPVPNRNVLNLINTQPGVVSGTNAAGGGTNVFGARDRAVNITLDGIDSNETSAGNATFSPIRTNPDSLREYRIITSNPSAEFGRNSGAQIALITNSGTNDFHGNLFEFYRDRVLNANEFQLNRAGIPRRFLLRNQYGGSIGGPIFLPRFGEGGRTYYNGRNKSFFFFNTQIQRQNQTLEQVNTVYTATARAGIFRYATGARNNPFNATGASIDAQGNPIVPIATYNVIANDPRRLGLDPTVQSILSLTPLPNTFEVGDGLNTAGFRSLASRTDPQRDFTIRLDHTFSDTQNIFGRYSFGQQDTVGDTTNNGAARFPGLPPIVATFRTPKNIAIGLRSTYGAATTNELIVGANRFIFDFAIPSNRDSRTTPFVLQTITNPLSNSFGNKRTINTFQVLDNVSRVAGAHTFRFGTNLRLQEHYDVRGSVAGLDVNPEFDLGNTVDTTRFQVPTNINTNDRATANGLVNNLLGRLASASVGLVDTGGQFGPPGTAFTFDAFYPEGDFYFQDDWKIRPNITLNLGLRWEPKPKPYARGRNKIFVPDRPLTLGSAPATNVSYVQGDLYKSDYNNFGPAIGIAYDPFKDGRTAIRANFRVAFDRISTFLPSAAIYPNTPGLTTTATFTTPARSDLRILDGVPALAPAQSNPNALRTPPPNTIVSREVLDPNFVTPTTYMYSLGAQREIGKGFVVDVEYIGRAGRHLIGGFERNQVNIFSNGFLDAFVQAQAGNVPAGSLLDRLTAPARTSSQNAVQYLNATFPTQLARNSVADVAARLNNTFVTVSGARTRLVEAAGFSPFFFNDYPQFLGGLQVIDSNSFSNYNGAFVQLQRRLQRGLQFDLSYTFSKSLDDKSFDPTFTRIASGTSQSAQSTPFDPANRRLNYGISDFDRTHVLQGNATYELPFGPGRRFLRSSNGLISRLVGGFTLGTTIVYESGLPFTIVTGTNSFSNRISSRTNYSGSNRSLRYTIDPTTGTRSLFTTEQLAQFTLPAAGQIGNTPRNGFRLPPLFNMDASLIKHIAIRESMNLELRAEAFNVTNTPYFGFPSSATITSSVFGQNLSTESAARIIQLGIKFNF